MRQGPELLYRGNRHRHAGIVALRRRGRDIARPLKLSQIYVSDMILAQKVRCSVGTIGRPELLYVRLACLDFLPVALLQFVP
jgi:hypothetical protein